MAKAVTLKNSNDEEVYPVTDISLVNGELNGARIVNASVGSDKLTPNAVWEENIKDGVVTADKLAWSTLTSYHLLRNISTINVTGTALTNIASLTFTCDKAGTYFLAANGNYQVYGSSTGTYPRIGIYKGNERLTYAALSISGYTGQQTWSTFITAQLAVGDVVKVAVAGGAVQLYEGQTLFAIRVG